MQHLDEGIIHAWLDGALDAEESARIEAHVAQCETCSAAVAEARGLIAGTSRILGALDHVPVNVIPRAAEGAAPAATITPARVRRFRVTPAWMAAAAAVLVIAVSVLVRRDHVVATMASKEAYSVPANAPVAAPARMDTGRSAGDALGTSSGAAASSAPKQVVTGETGARRAVPQPMVAAAPTAPPPVPSGEVRGMVAARGAENAMAKKAEERLAQASERQVADSSAVVSADSARADRSARLRSAFTAPAAQQVVATVAPAEAKDAAVAAPRAFQGCYEVASASLNAAPAPMPPAAVPMRDQRRSAAAGMVAGRASVATTAFVLDSTKDVRGGASAVTKVVFAAPATSTRNVIGSWALLSPNSAQVNFNDGRPALFLTLTPGGEVHARPSNDTTLPATVLRRCP